MKTRILLASVLAVRLTLAGGACAQETPAPAGPVAPRLEVGAALGAIWLEPTVGILASVRTSPRSSVEGGAHLTPYFMLTQAQMRVRLPIGPPGGSRRSLVLGLSHLSLRSTDGGVRHGGLAAHAGMSAQAPLTRRLDLRADLQMLMPFRAGPNADPRAVVTFVWHL
jgi:hypothetical protein